MELMSWEVMSAFTLSIRRVSRKRLRWPRAFRYRPEAGVDGLLPLGLFKTVYVCNSEGYVVFE